MRFGFLSATASVVLSYSASAFTSNAAPKNKGLVAVRKQKTFLSAAIVNSTTADDLSSKTKDEKQLGGNDSLYDRTPRPEYIPNKISDPDYVRILDTTLRDGEQSPGATLTSAEKLEIAWQLSKLGVDVIEAGFPIASPDDFSAVKQIADTVGNEVYDDGYVPVISGLCRANPRDIETGWNAVKGAKLPRIHTFIATSKIHMEAKLKKTPDEVVQIAIDAVKFAKSLGCHDIQFSAEDAGRSDPEFLVRIFKEVIKAGATTINIPDTTGWNMPWEFGGLIQQIRDNLPESDQVIWSTHCHNDLGLATANTLNGALNGARQLECTINGIGERAGNAALEEVAMALKLKGDSDFQGGPGTGKLWSAVNPVHITPTSKMVSEYTGMSCQANKAIVGARAFAQALENRGGNEIMKPESVGLMRSEQEKSGIAIALTRHSSKEAVALKLRKLGYDLDEAKISAVYTRFLKVAERKKWIEDDDLEALADDCQAGLTNSLWEITGLQVSAGFGTGLPTATVQMCGPDGVERHVATTGTGPVDAVYKAIDQIVGVSVELESYQMNSVTEGIEALAATKVVIKPKLGGPSDRLTRHSQSGKRETRKFSGFGSDTDIVISSARAYISALNKLLSWNKLRG